MDQVQWTKDRGESEADALEELGCWESEPENV